jgi:hypothetical protein
MRGGRSVTSIEDIRTCIQEWMMQELTAVNLAKTYAEIKLELDKQLEVCMEGFTGEGEKA